MASPIVPGPAGPRPAAGSPRLSIIIPVLDEALLVERSLAALAALRDRGAEIIVVDGGSRDGTAELAKASGLADVVLCAGRGRAVQMNAGAARARGEALLFLHVDTQVPADAGDAIAAALAGAGRWGRFDVRIDGRHWLLPVVARAMNLRSRLTGIATGDQGVFVTRKLFAACGGFPELPLMEDIALSRILKKHAAPVCLRETVTTSGRRWERHGVLATIVLMWCLRLAYFFGVSPQTLARSYARP